MARQIFVDVTSAGEMNRVCISVDHDNQRKRVFIACYPAQERPDGQVVVAITNGKYLNLEEMRRRNNKRLDALLDDVKEQMASKRGAVYDLVVKLCEEYKLALK